MRSSGESQVKWEKKIGSHVIFSQVYMFSFGSIGSINGAVLSKGFSSFFLSKAGKTAKNFIRLPNPHIGYAKLAKTLGGLSVSLWMAASYCFVCIFGKCRSVIDSAAVGRIFSVGVGCEEGE